MMPDQSLRLGYRQKHMLNFLVEHPGRHYVNSGHRELRVACSLEKRGLIRLTDYGMCTATGKTCYMAQAITEENNESIT